MSIKNGCRGGVETIKTGWGSVWLQAKVRERGLGLQHRLNADLVQRRRFAMQVPNFP